MTGKITDLHIYEAQHLIAHINIKSRIKIIPREINKDDVKRPMSPCKRKSINFYWI